LEYRELDDLISSLQNYVELLNPHKGYWSELWTLVKQINSGFKEVKYPSREDKEKAWALFQGLIKRAKERSEQNKARIRQQEEEWERKKQKSKFTKEEIILKAESAGPMSGFQRSFSEIFVLPGKIIADVITGLFGMNDDKDLDDIYKELLECNRALEKGWELFNQNIELMLPGDKNEAYKYLQDARKKLDYAWSQWKEKKTALKVLRKRQVEEKHALFLERVKCNVAKLEEKLEKAEGALIRQQSLLEDLREKYDSAWSDNYRRRCGEWIQECEDRIVSIKEHINKLEDWLKKERTKLG